MLCPDKAVVCLKLELLLSYTHGAAISNVIPLQRAARAHGGEDIGVTAAGDEGKMINAGENVVWVKVTRRLPR